MPLDAPDRPCYIAPVFRRSSAVEQLTVNQLVVGSIPTAGANKNKHLGDTAARCELLKHSMNTVFAFCDVLGGVWRKGKAIRTLSDLSHRCGGQGCTTCQTSAMKLSSVRRFDRSNCGNFSKNRGALKRASRSSAADSISSAANNTEAARSAY